MQPLHLRLINVSLAAMTTKKRKRSPKLIPHTPSTPPTPQTQARHSFNTAKARAWAPLNLIQAELSLPLTFPTGQTFRWKNTAPLEYTGVVGPHLVTLKHLQNGDVCYCLHSHSHPEKAETALLDFLNAAVSLSGLWKAFSASDARFAALARHLSGARVLRQDPFECLIQFLCSSNNNIARITKMVDHVSSLGVHVGDVGGFQFHVFPSLEQLSSVSEQQLRDAGFGYRAKYIIGTVNALRSKPGGGEEWLRSLRKLDLPDVISALSTLPGVGPKVAACIALFSLDQHHAVPVDTHVWRIATKYLLPELAGSQLTPKLCNRVAEAFVTKYGKYAGWAQTLLFIAELPSQKAIIPSHLWTIKQRNPAKVEDGEEKVGVTCCCQEFIRVETGASSVINEILDK
ncbi:N-glycosylase/DNA lyase OGG1 8-oxoguanine DNA glycosylase [Vigna angularis]|uniref:DNA-(apurinic or apyrimidinic site) lyase n=1 Tax=Phaseolus angularis TaxID=3914 RepID=A0A8T0KJH4_PHAAN|nr:N-glycosylase/DNA lyase OGG1 8-oxoguanine DNA glycosylase [Vigna angularis]